LDAALAEHAHLQNCVTFSLFFISIHLEAPDVSTSVELSVLHLRYEGYRLRDEAREARLLSSIAQRGMEEPLEGVDTPDGRLLLNGFKRYRWNLAADVLTTYLGR
jgi:hypothetical protein